MKRPICMKIREFFDTYRKNEYQLKPYLIKDGKTHPVAIVCPGGGYTMKCVDKEGTLIAEKLNRMGIHAFVLDYRVVPYHMPVMLLDAQRAIRYVRCFAKQFGVKADKIGIMGFSAGRSEEQHV